MSTPQKLLIEGSSDAIGFVGGALLGWGVGHVLGLDLFATGYGAGSIVAIVLVGLGGGLGLKLARLWRNKREPKSKTV
ncbi:hypothetical protein KUF54_15975 [Comamonas sp. Y33R10-2]|uniref:hypothetical protein n=1 Tax=Comamonas sp. Y33R10-2 TaxID=2853257 RepID=UPI001C5C8F73|nr:hypothetical protein [Comamonas sp. Y33R10-2]QXZ09488.1 hypothetical protein KUF54_15975 [Comamonas sp. Y33R10-2]